MSDLDRRTVVASLASLGFAAGGTGVLAQQPPQAQTPGTAPVGRFSFDDVVRRARELSLSPLVAAAALPDQLGKLDDAAWRDIRFRADRALLGNNGGLFRLQLFHLGSTYRQPVTVNVIRDGLAAPVPYAPNLFDYGRTKFEKPLPLNIGFAGFRLHYPLNDPRGFDELITFLGASYFRFLGRGQRFGSSARGLTVNAGSDAEEFPFFREFWVDSPGAASDTVTVYALLDGESVTGAYKFEVRAGIETVIDVSATLFARREGAKFGLAPLASLFFSGENDRRIQADFRPELHDADGLMLHSGAGEWLWRPLRNPAQTQISAFSDTNIRGFGLIQRDRDFSHFQDLDSAYELRPSYWIEPQGDWGEGHLELLERPAADAGKDNILAYWLPKNPFELGKPVSLSYRITASLDLSRLFAAGKVISTYLTPAKALGSSDPAPANAQRFVVDFAGGDLVYYQTQPSSVEVVATASLGKVSTAFLVANPHTKGFRAAIDVQAEPGQLTDLRLFLRSGDRNITEIWTLPWQAP